MTILANIAGVLVASGILAGVSLVFLASLIVLSAIVMGRRRRFLSRRKYDEDYLFYEDWSSPTNRLTSINSEAFEKDEFTADCGGDAVAGSRLGAQWSSDGAAKTPPNPS